MTEQLAPLHIPRPILEEIYQEARTSYPAECCGWLAGPGEGSEATRVRRCVNAQESGRNQATPDRGAENAYAFTDQDAIDLYRSLETDEPALVIYHSHPNGRAYFSETDRMVAMGPWPDEGPAYPVQQLVVGIDEQRVVEAALFAWSDEAREFVEIARFEGAEI